MPKYKINYTSEFKAIEAFTVLIKKERPSRSYPKKDMLLELARPQIYLGFLKICLENDQSSDLMAFRMGLLLVLKSIGITSIAKKINLPRVTIYRMLSKKGNPSLKNLVALLKALDLHFWIVDQAYLKRGAYVRRYNKL